MGRRIFALVTVFVFLVLLASPVFAFDNTIGVVQQDFTFLGLSFGVSNRCEEPATDGIVPKIYQDRPDVYIPAGSYTYFFWAVPESITAPCTASLTLNVSWRTVVSNASWYGCKYDGTNSFVETYLGPATYAGGFTWSRFSQLRFEPFSFDLSGYDVIRLGIKDNSDRYADIAYTFSESGSFSNNLSTVFPSLETDFYLSTYNTSDPIWQYYDQYGTIYNKKENVQFAKAHIRLPSTVMDIHGTTSGTITGSDPYNYIASSLLSAVYGNDGGLVDTVQHMDKTLDTVSGNMQKIVDNMDKQDDAAADIGTAVGDQTISNTGETLSGGITAVDDISGALDTSLHVSSASGYMNLLAVGVNGFWTFGNGIYRWAFLVILVMIVLFFVLGSLRRD